MPDFDGAGAKEGMEVWRVENKVPVPVPTKMYGHFYEGDSYICLKTTRKGSGLAWDIFFWLGKDSTQDEQGVAAYKTVELDEMLTYFKYVGEALSDEELIKAMEPIKAVYVDSRRLHL